MNNFREEPYFFWGLTKKHINLSLRWLITNQNIKHETLDTHRYRRGAAYLRYRNGGEITVFMWER